jgi:hypothetical protein
MLTEQDKADVTTEITEILTRRVAEVYLPANGGPTLLQELVKLVEDWVDAHDCEAARQERYKRAER